MSISFPEALPGKLDIKRYPPSILNISDSLAMSAIVLKALAGKLVIKTLTKYSLYILSVHISKQQARHLFMLASQQCGSRTLIKL